jgi:hypothetical protein
LINLGFITEGKLAAVLITPSLGVSNWSVIYIINTVPPLATNILASPSLVPVSAFFYQRVGELRVAELVAHKLASQNWKGLGGHKPNEPIKFSFFETKLFFSKSAGEAILQCPRYL